MTTLREMDATGAVDAPGPAQPGRRRRRVAGRLAERLLLGYTWLIVAWLLLPIAVMIAFSFNDTHDVRTPPHASFTWVGFTTKWYGQAFTIPNLTDALFTSVLLAVLTMLVAGTLGTLLGLALGRYRFRGHGATNLIMFAVISSPELVLGASLLSFFVQLNVGRGLLTILIAHVMFSISFVAIVVRSRVMTLDPSLEEAARDLGANPLTTFWLVTFPMIFPAILSGGLLAFALSIDDFIITNFTAGTIETFPLLIWSGSRQGLPPQVNVMGTLIFAVGLLIAVSNSVVARRRSRR